ncbi:hypothetical protein MUK42_20359 [Musa troglodytarum]|uniref:Uncharacterized protein n=1 Tax=Musa troglodytarum TaxID=320322 RepID=A0A9E7FW88_9LILI|nr:hypothetical protein MUK42_20359 [Musa troglodytarum]
MGGSPPAMPPRRAIEEAHPPDRSRTGEPSARPRRTLVEEEQVRVGRRALEAVLENRRTALELLENADVDPDSAARGEEGSPPMPMRLPGNKLEDRSAGNIFITEHRYSLDDNASWDMVTARDLWEDRLVDGENDSEQDDFVLVRQEDIVDGIACFMADYYLLSLQQMKFALQEFTPNQLQDALCKTFSVKKRSQLRKAWDGSRVTLQCCFLECYCYRVGMLFIVYFYYFLKTVSCDCFGSIFY